MTIDYAKARETMVEQQVRPWDVLDLRVLHAVSTVRREAFVPEAHKSLAYMDIAIPLAHGQSMMKPVLEGRMLQALDLQPGEEVLEIGTGSGYISACLGTLARDVLSLELHADLADAARSRLREQGVDNVRIEVADALGWNTGRVFDAVCVTGAMAQVPARFLQWLRPNGRMFVVHGIAPAMDAVLLRQEAGAVRSESLLETDLPYLVGAAPAPSFTF